MGGINTPLEMTNGRYDAPPEMTPFFLVISTEAAVPTLLSFRPSNFVTFLVISTEQLVASGEIS